MTERPDVVRVRAELRRQFRADLRQEAKRVGIGMVAIFLAGVWFVCLLVLVEWVIG